MRYKISAIISCLLLIFNANAQVTVHVNSGNPKIPFPQFLAYTYGTEHSLDNLGTQNPEGVVHAEMEQDIIDAYQIFANEFDYTGDELNGVKYIRGNIGCPYDCTEGTGYSLLAAAIMGDKTTFDGLWCRTHDTFRGKTKRYLDCSDNQADYAYGKYPLAEPGGNTATDGDVDIALALYIAWRQWGDYMGINDACGNAISYKKEMIEVIRGLVVLSTRFPTEDPKRCNSGDIGLDGYLKNGDTWTEETSWATDNKRDIDGDGALEYPEYGGPQTLHVDYSAPAYFREFYELLTSLTDSETGSSEWEREQYRKAEASCDWFVGNWVAQNAKNIPFGGYVAVNGTTSTWTTFSQGEDFRAPWRTILNYVWHGNPTYSWNPTTHEVESGSNSYELNGGKRYSDYMNDPQSWQSGNTCTEMGGGPEISYKGPSTLQWDITPQGSGSGAFNLNWVPACGTPAAVAAQDMDLLGLLYRHCDIEWDVQSGGSDGYLDSEPVYFHGWFRLLGMLIASGNHIAPSQMIAKPNLKIYRAVQDSLSYAYTGDSFTYLLDYRNYGSVDATGTKIVENVPEDFIFVSASNGGTYDAATHTVTWNIGTVPGFKTDALDVTKGQVSYVVKVGPNASGRYCTTAEISCTNGLGWTSNEYPNYVTPTMQRNCVDVIKRSLLIEKTANLEECNPGNVVTYSIKFENSSEAGWLDGGRPRVGISVSNAIKNGGSQMWLRFRLYNDAIEPYINYGNYRISYYIYDASMKCVVSDADCSVGWGWYTAIYEGKRSSADKVTVSHETVVEGSDAYGKWNQRLMLQFAPLLVTTTAHLSNYYGMGARIHRGGTEPLRVAGYIYPSNWAATDFEDDWSWNADVSEDEDDGLFSPVTPSWQEIDPTTGKSIERTINEYIPCACETPEHTIPNILVEEYDGYTWRRILGTGPMAGRDANNVVIRDTLPKGLTFLAFQGNCPLASSGANWTTDKTSDGRDIVIWTIPTLQIKQKGTINYTATATFPSGKSCSTDDEDIDNVAWLYADLNSPIGDTATITVTCAKVPTPIVPTTLKKTPSTETVSVGDEISYTLEYEQTHGFTTDNAGANASDWDCSNASVSSGTVSVNSNVTATAKYKYSYAKNSYIEFNCSLQKDDNTYLILRDNIEITLRPEYATMKITCSQGGTQKKQVDINSGGSASFRIAIDVTDDILRMWIGTTEVDTSASAAFTVEGLTVATGYFSIKNTTYGSPKYSNIHVHTDYAYNLSIVDELPSELTYVSSDNSGAVSGSNVVWEFEQGLANPIAPNKKYTVTVTATVNECNEKIINEAHVSLLGHTDDEIRAQATVECGASCPAKPIVTTPVTYCQGETATALTATGTALKWYTTATGGTAQSSITPSTTDAGTTTYYVSQTENGCESTRAAIDVVVNPKPTTPTITSNSPVCAGNELNLSAPLLEDATYAWTGPNSFTSTERQPSIASATSTSAGEYTVIVTSKNECESDAGTATIVVNTIPDAPTVTTPLQYCKGETVSDNVSATGTDLKWYTTESGTTEFTSLIPATTTVGSVHYYVSQTIDGCESERADLEVQTLEPPSKPTITTNSPVCVGSTITLSTDAEGTYEWSGPNSFTSTKQKPGITSATTDAAGEYTLVVTVGNCSSEAGTATVVVNTIPTTPVPTNNGPKCDGEDVTLTVAAVANATYTWSGPNSFTSTEQNPKTKTAGEYTLVITIADCPSEAGSTTVVINNIPTLPTVTTPIQYCQGETVSDEVSATGENLTWYSTETGTAKCSSLIPTTTTVGSVHYYVSQTVNNCESERADLEVQTLAPPSKPTITTNSPVCAGESITLETTAEGTYSWSGPNSFTSTEKMPTITSATADADGEYSLIVKVGNCTSEAGTATVVVNPVPTISIDAVANLCVDATDVTLKATATPVGGTGSFSGPGVSGSTFSPTTAGVGTHTITYTYEVNGCSKSETINIVVQDKPKVSFTLPTTACKSGSVITLIGNQTGGTFSASPSIDVTSGFNPANATIGQKYTITYEYTDGVCTNSTSNTITVYDPEKPVGTDVSKVYTKVTTGNIPALTATGVNQIWYSDAALTNQIGTGSSYTPAESDVLDGTVGKVGTYTYYVVSTDGGCTSEKTAVTLEISSCAAEAPIPVNNIVKVCYGETNDAKKTLSVTAGTGNIRWYYNETKVQDDASTSYIPTQSDAGSYTFYVSLYDTDANCESGKSSITYIINELPSVSFDLPAEVCEASTEIDFSTYKSQATGTITETAGNTIVTSFNPTTAGTYEFEYAYTDENSCTNTITDAIIVNALPTISITSVPDKCEYDDEFSLTTYATPTGGTFSGDGVSQGSKFNPAAVTAGSKPEITYTYTDAKSCTNTETFTIAVIARPTITFTNPESSCIGDNEYDLLQYVTPQTGSFTGEHITGTKFNPEEVGNFDITYTVTESGCSTTMTKTAKVNALPTITITANSIECVNTGEITPTLSPIGGTLTINDNVVTSINTNTLTAGSYTLKYAYTDANKCSNEKSQALEIRKIESPQVTDKSVVVTSTDLTISATGNGGTITWEDENGTKTTGNTISHSSSAVAGTWKYCATESDGTCTSEPACMTFTVIDCPTSAPTVTPATQTICANDEIPTFNVTATGIVNWYKDNILQNNLTTFTPSDLKGKTGTYTWTVTQTEECEGAPTTVTLTINPNPVISISNTKTDLCDYDSDVEIETTTDIIGGTFTYSGETVSNNKFVPTSATTGSAITITVSYEAPNGCTATTTKDFTVHHVDALSVTSPVTQLESDYETVLTATPDGTNTITWYDACGTKVKLGTGNSFSTGLVGEKSEDYGVTQTDKYGCESECAPIQVNRIKCPTPAPDVIVSTNEICATDEVPTFTASGIGSTFRWYENGTLISEDKDFTPTTIQGKAGSYAWTVTQTTTGTNGCEGVATPVTLKINASPEISVTLDNIICQNEGVKTPISNLIGTTFTFDGNTISSIDPTLYEPGTYTLTYSYSDPKTGCRAVSVANNCYENECLQQQVEIRSIPSVKVGNITKLVTSDEFKVSIQSGNGGAYTWTDESNNLVGIGASIDHAYSHEVGSWTYCVTETDGVCTSDPSCMLFSIINCPVPAPTVVESHITGCTNETIPTLEAKGDYTLQWYNGNDMNTIIAYGSTFTPNDITAAGDYKYYVTQNDGECEGLPTEISLQMFTTPLPKITGNKTICENEELTLSADDIALWYSDQNLIHADEIATNHIVTYDKAGTYQLYVTKQDDHCVSNPVTVNIAVNAIPSAPQITVNNVCKGDDITFSAEGTDVQWYRYGSVIEEGTTYTESNTLPGSITIAATQTIANCVSPMAEVTATVFDIPSKPQAVNVTICDYNPIEPVSVILQADAEATWYNDEYLITPIAQNVDSYTPKNKQSQTFYVTQSANGCTSEAAKVVFTVNLKPNDVVFKQASDVIACEGNQVVLIAESSNKVFWYDTQDGKPVFTGRYFTVPSTEVGSYTYYATQTDAAGCVSNMTPKKVTIQAGPTAANLIQGDTLCIYEEPGRLIVARNSENESVSWISPTGATLGIGDTLDVPAGLITKAGNYRFKARTTVASCSFDTRRETIVPYVVYPKPASPTLTKEAFCYDGQTITVSTQGENPIWYDSDNNILAAFTQEYKTNYNAVGEYSIRLTQAQNGCISDTVERKFLISAIPTPVITGNTGMCTGANEAYVVTKSAESNTITWEITGNRVSYELSSYSTGFVRSIDWTEEGLDTIFVRETNKYGCVGEAALAVQVTPNPDAQFTTESLGQEGVVTFSNLSECQILESNGTEKEFHVDYFWDFGRNIDTALVMENSKTFEQVYKYGNYTAELTAVNEFGCSTSVKETFFVDVQHGLYVPTAFAPTNPAEDVRIFKPKGFNCRTFEIWIYDQWNNLVYYSSGVNEHGAPLAEWDGRVNGKLMQAGVYRYKIEVTFEDHSEENLKITQTVKPIWGNVNLIR